MASVDLLWFVRPWFIMALLKTVEGVKPLVAYVAGVVVGMIAGYFIGWFQALRESHQ